MLENQVNFFRISDRIEAMDLAVIRDGLFRFFKSNPTFTVLDLSGATIDVESKDLERVLTEIQVCAQAQNLHFLLARNALESINASQTVMELALEKQVEILQAKLELRESMRKQAEKLIEENAQLKASVTSELEKMRALSPESSRLSPILEKLWSEK